MKPGQGSRTAVMVCAARAAAHGRTTVEKFADPTALELLPDDARAEVERFHAGGAPSGFRDRMARTFLDKRSKMMIARTVAIDEGMRAAASPQVVILGAGLDGRAWRMSELRDAVVFEVDHPDSQREKRERIAASALTQMAREVRFVPVDFTRDDLDDALARGGHDPTRPTTWVWEGVVMYLTPAEVEATLAVVRSRSAEGSRLIVLYSAPSAFLRLVGIVVRRVGEPFRSSFSPEAMGALLTKYGFEVVNDEGLPAIGAAMSEDVAQATRVMKHLRLVVADARRWA